MTAPGTHCPPGRSRESEPSPEQSDEEVLFSDEAAEYYEDLVAGARTVGRGVPVRGMDGAG